MTFYTEIKATESITPQRISTTLKKGIIDNVYTTQEGISNVQHDKYFTCMHACKYVCMHVHVYTY